jgi:hypothetical protein
MKIAVKEIHDMWQNNDVTVQILEDGDLIQCNHAGATWEDVSDVSFYGDEMSEQWEQNLVCDKCGEQSDSNGRFTF